jgi:predicted ATPase/DNA-binding CsgD family transcriptional regulator
LTSLLGRETEIDQICEMLDTDTIRLLTLTGPGGIGKTRIALEVASRLESEYAHGACFVPLAPIQDVTHVIPAVAKTLGIQESGDATIAEVLSSVLQDRHMLLALDNFEHVLGAAAPWLSDLLARCPRLTVLVTSRAALHVTGEWRFSVPPLPVPDARSLDMLLENAAVKLFVARAAAVHHDFALDEANAESVRDICHHLDGIPLAIELAAAGINVLTPAELLHRLTHQQSVLTGNGHLPVRHQTMRNAIAWSYDLLSEPEQSLFRRMCVFVGGFSLGAAEAVRDSKEDVSDLPVFDLVASLVDHSLIRKVARANDASRLTMLEPIREFGLERLSAHGEQVTARDAHAVWYLHMARESEPAIEGPDQVVLLNRLELEHGNIRAALSWLTKQERIEEALDLAGSIWLFLSIRGLYAEGRQWYEALLVHSMGMGRTVPRAKVLFGLGTIAHSQGDMARAQAAYEEAISILREQDACGHLSRAMQGLGCTFFSVGRNDEAEAICADSLNLARRLDDAWVIAATLNILGLVAAYRGDSEMGERHMQECVDVCRTSGNRWGLSLCLMNLGAFAMARGGVAQAERHWQELVALGNELGDRRGLSFGLMSLAEVDRYRGEYGSAKFRLMDALTHARDVGEIYLVGYVLIGLGRLAAVASRDAHRAVAFLREGIETLLTLGNENDLAQCLDAFADVTIAMREVERAARFIGSADAVLDRSDTVRQPIQPGEHQARLDAMVAVLGEQGFHEAWTAGKMLSREEALAEALAFEPVHAAAPKATAGITASGAAAGLTSRELEVLRSMADGLTNQEIADTLSISNRTATSHASNVLGKLGLDSRTAAVAFAIRNGLA